MLIFAVETVKVELHLHVDHAIAICRIQARRREDSNESVMNNLTDDDRQTSATSATIHQPFMDAYVRPQRAVRGAVKLSRRQIAAACA